MTAFIWASGETFLDTIASGIRSYSLAGDPVAGSYLHLRVTQTNGTGLNFGVTNQSGGLTQFQMLEQLIGAVNAALSGSDGLRGQDLFNTSPWTASQTAQFNFVPNTTGWGAAGIQVALSVSTEITLDPTGPTTLEQNLADLQPRAHLYIVAGVTNLQVGFPLDTTALAYRHHQLTAVIYEGSHVRTQRRVTQAGVKRVCYLS